MRIAGIAPPPKIEPSSAASCIDEEVHAGPCRNWLGPPMPLVGPQAMLDTILTGWTFTTAVADGLGGINGANDGLVRLWHRFGVLARPPAVSRARCRTRRHACFCSLHGSRCHTSPRRSREVQEAEFRRERQELEIHPEEEEEELALFYN